MAIPNTLIKDPDESKVYEVDFSAHLASGETLSSPVVASTPSGLTVGSPSISGSSVQFRLSGGTSGTTYTIDVTVSTSASNALNGCVRLLVQDCGWLSEMVTMLRLLINDFSSTPTYTDNRLAKILLLGARYVQQEIDFDTTYTINVGKLTLSPDPTGDTTRDENFINFVVLKASCIVDQSTYRTKAATEGIRAVCGPASLTVTGHLKGFQWLLDNGPCNTYEQLKMEYMFGNSKTVQAVLSPFRSNKFDPITGLTNDFAEPRFK